MIRIPTIPPPEELARRPAGQAVALAILDGVRLAVVSAAVVLGATAVMAGLAWTSFRFGTWVYAAVAGWENDGLPVSLAGLAAGGMGGLAMFVSLLGITAAPEWIEARAGHKVPPTLALALYAAWWAVVCGAVWTLT